MSCPYCGTDVPPSGERCPSCSRPLPGVTVVASVLTPPPAVPPPDDDAATVFVPSTDMSAEDTTGLPGLTPRQLDDLEMTLPSMAGDERTMLSSGASAGPRVTR